ncbi:MAG: hypothetical protein JXA66_01620, partial [Oligoflexia bacterium]|nr:hypothetical protein [Oligoflexia bacterium]
AITSTNFNPMQIPLSFEERNFKIEAMGISGRVVSRITCYVSESYDELMKEKTEAKKESKKEKKKQPPLPGDYKPKIVYWEID